MARVPVVQKIHACKCIFAYLHACAYAFMYARLRARAAHTHTHTHTHTHMHMCTHPHVHTSRQLQPPKELIERYQQDRLKSAHQIDGVCVSMHACLCAPQLMPAHMDAHAQGSINGWSG